MDAVQNGIQCWKKERSEHNSLSKIVQDGEEKNTLVAQLNLGLVKITDTQVVGCPCQKIGPFFQCSGSGFMGLLDPDPYSESGLQKGQKCSIIMT